MQRNVTWIQIRSSVVFVCLIYTCVVHLAVGCLFVCLFVSHPDTFLQLMLSVLGCRLAISQNSSQKPRWNRNVFEPATPGPYVRWGTEWPIHSTNLLFRRRLEKCVIRDSGTETVRFQTCLKAIQTPQRFKRTLFIRTKHNTRIFGVIPFIKLQNDT